MRSAFVVTVVLLAVLSSLEISAQKRKPIVKTPDPAPEKLEPARVISIEDRQSLYMPVHDPKPCSVFLLDFGSTREKVVREAVRIGLVEEECDTSTTGSGSIFCMFSEPEYADTYTFVFDSNGVYNSFMFKEKKTEVAYAVRQHEKYIEKLWLNWDAERGEERANSNCSYSNQKRFVSIHRDEREVTLMTGVVRGR